MKEFWRENCKNAKYPKIESHERLCKKWPQNSIERKKMNEIQKPLSCHQLLSVH